MCENKYINYDDTYNKLFIDTDIFIIEICSNKKYIHNDFYLHHLCVDKRFIKFNNITPSEILDNFIIEKLYFRNTKIVSHYNTRYNGEYIQARSHLINLLDNICKKFMIPFINPTSYEMI